MKKVKLLNRPTRVSDISFEEMYDDDSQTDLKLERLMTRHRRLQEE